MENLESLGVRELNAKEIKETDGGWWIKISGILDGIKGNTSICFFCE